MAGNSLKLPDEYTEISYEDGELSGSGNRKWTSEDTQAAVKWGVSIIAAGTVLGLGIKYRRQIGNGISYAWNQITSCCSPNNEGLIEEQINNGTYRDEHAIQQALDGYTSNNSVDDTQLKIMTYKLVTQNGGTTAEILQRYPNFFNQMSEQEMQKRIEEDEKNDYSFDSENYSDSSRFGMDD